MLRCSRSVLLLAAAGFAAFAAAAAPIPQTLYDGMHWREIGPFRGGRALAAAGIPDQPNVYYFGSVGGGVWKTTDAGRTWQAEFQHGGTASIGALAIAPSNGNVIYVGTGEADMRSDITFGDGVYKSTDGGKTWQHLGLADTRHIGRILIDPKNPDIVLVAALGHAYGPNSERGVFRTTDGGRTWHKTLYKNAETGAVDLAWDPENPQVVYAALWQTKRPPWSQYPPLGGPGSGLFKSTDEGKTWTQIKGHGFPAGELGRIGVGVARNDHGRRVYALVQATQPGKSGLYRSDDAGASWQLVSTNKQITTRMWYFGRVTVDPADPNTIFLPNRSIFRSTDGGKTFTVIKGEPGGDDYHFLWINPDHPQDMIVASDQGTVVTLNNGETWSSWYNQPTAQFYHVSTDHRFPYHIYGAQQDSGSVDITSRSPDGKITFRDWHATAGGESGYIIPKPENPGIVYGDGYGASVDRLLAADRTRQDISPWPVGTFDQKQPDVKYRSVWTPALAVNPKEPDALYFGTQFVMKTTDGGLNWRRISPDLTGQVPHASTHGPLTVANARERGWGVVYSIAPSPLNAKVIWAGTDDGLVWITRDSGRRWHDITPPHTQTWSKIAVIEPSPFDVHSAYIVIDRHRLDDFHPYIFRTRDDGRTWTKITDGLSAPAFVRVVRADPERKGLLYAGTELGVAVSFDDGNHWQPLQLNLPTAPVRDLAIEQGDLVAATHGRGFWILDDLSPLRQMSAKIADESAHLFAPAVAYRVRPGNYGGTPLPPETPAGENPPSGAIIDYYLKADAKRPVTLTIRDAARHIVRRYASDTQPPKIDYSDVYFEHSWLKPPAKLSGAAGMHRFIWDLRRDPPPAIEASPFTRGLLMPAGQYSVTLTVNGKNYTRPLTVKPDPRMHVERANVKRQLQFGDSIEAAMAKARDAYTGIKALRAELAARRQQANAAGVRDTIERLDNAAASLEDHDKQSFAAINGGLGALESKLDDSDRPPPRQYEMLFEEYRHDLDASLDRWQKLRTTQVEALNHQLTQAHLAPVKSSGS
ncbi:MAG TPA: hypothetical protein VFL54_01360 [Gammaproteobacteria bacterium]|nr:hypothetical protein [Gammaproteobacteria bacterium]